MSRPYTEGKVKLFCIVVVFLCLQVKISDDGRDLIYSRRLLASTLVHSTIFAWAVTNLA